MRFNATTNGERLVSVVCSQCKNAFYCEKWDSKRRKYCSRKCSYEYRKGKLLTGYNKNSIPKRGVDHHNWKENVTYFAVHNWIRRNYGSANKCEKCFTKKSKRYEWACIGEYKKEVSNFMQLCKSCHNNLDCQSKESIEKRASKIRGVPKHLWGK